MNNVDKDLCAFLARTFLQESEKRIKLVSEQIEMIKRYERLAAYYMEMAEIE